jgi:hypothetical protein
MPGWHHTAKLDPGLRWNGDVGKLHPHGSFYSTPAGRAPATTPPCAEAKFLVAHAVVAPASAADEESLKNFFKNQGAGLHGSCAPVIHERSTASSKQPGQVLLAFRACRLGDDAGRRFSGSARPHRAGLAGIFEELLKQLGEGGNRARRQFRRVSRNDYSVIPIGLQRRDPRPTAVRAWSRLDNI